MNIALRHGAHLETRTPVVEPLVDAQSAYPAIERAVLAARDHLWISLRVFDPDTFLVSEEAREQGLLTWGHLVADAVTRGVDVRIALADFDPVVMDGLHRFAWRSVDGFAKAIANRCGDRECRAEVIAVVHEGEVGTALRTLFWPVAFFKLKRIARELEAGDGDDGGRDGLDHAPGLWSHLSRDEDGVHVAPWPPIRLWPATHHQKLVIVDRKVAFVGGLDIDARRFDTHDHDRPAPRTWHDVMVRVPGDVACALGDWFVDHWNKEAPRARRLAADRGWTRPAVLAEPSRIDPAPVDPDADKDPVTKLMDRARREAEANGDGAAGEDADVRVIATRSERLVSPFAIGPSLVERRVHEAYLDLVADARDLLYIETQFFRDPEITEAIVAQAWAARNLRLVMVLPAAPEDIAFYGDHGRAMRHGEWLQTRALDRVIAAYGGRCGLFTLATRRPREEVSERDSVFGAGAIYVHAKVAVADDRHAIVSSANLNPRSMHWDTELGVAWTDPKSAGSLRRRLFATHLGEAAVGLPPDGETVLELWRRIATDNVLLEPPDRTGFVLPFPLEQTRQFARRTPFVPAELL